MKTTKQMVSELRDMQRQIIHGKNTFGEIADRLENQEAALKQVARDCEHSSLDHSIYTLEMVNAVLAQAEGHA